MPVSVKREPVVLPTYAPCAADPHPQFIETRVYQGSSGQVREAAAGCVIGGSPPAPH